MMLRVMRRVNVAEFCSSELGKQAGFEVRRLGFSGGRGLDLINIHPISGIRPGVAGSTVTGVDSVTTRYLQSFK